MAGKFDEAADQTGVIFGQLVWTCYGGQTIPAAWRSTQALEDRIGDYADPI